MRRFAYYDELTGLPNRRLFADRMRQAIARALRYRERIALVFIDLDGFKLINDSFGHAAGDHVLQQVAARLKACMRASDTACRYGGDEFVALLPQVDGWEDERTVAAKLRECLAPRYTVGAATVAVTVSLGTAVYPRIDSLSVVSPNFLQETFRITHTLRRIAWETSALEGGWRS